MIPRVVVYAEIDKERDHQDQKWGTPKQHPHEVGGWLLIMEHLLAKARAAWVTNGGDVPALEEIRQVVAVGVACMEQNGVMPRRKGSASIEDRTQQDWLPTK